MAGKKVNTEEMFQSLIGGRDSDSEVVVRSERTPPAARQAEAPQKEKFRQRAFYLTEAQIRAIGLKSVDTGKDKSAIVREALEKCLKEYL